MCQNQIVKSKEETTANYEVGFPRLRATLEKMKSLKPSAFNYSGFMTRFDSAKMCQTIGCVAGYLLFWFEDTGFRYSFVGNISVNIWLKSIDVFSLNQTIKRFEKMHIWLEMGIINPNWERNSV